MNVSPNFSFEAVLDSGTVGLVGTLGLELNDNLGSTVISFSTGGIIEIAPGVYTASMTSPGTAGQYTLIWRASAGGTVVGIEDLVVSISPVAPVGPPPVIIPPISSVGGMTFKQIQDECCNFRFGEGRRSSVKLWINRRMQSVWGEAEWPFKRVNRQHVITDSNGLLVMPTGFRRAIALEDSESNQLTYLVPEEFRDQYPGDQSTGGVPSVYTTWNGQVLFDSNPGPDGTFLLSYLRRICVLDNNGFIREGLLTADGDYPLWDPEHHFLLVLGASSTGLKLENDFTWNALEDEFGMALTEMKDDLMPPDTVGNIQYGADDL